MSHPPARRVVAEPEVVLRCIQETRIRVDIEAVVVEVSRAVRRDPTLHAGIGNADRRLRPVVAAIRGDLHARVAPENAAADDDRARVGDRKTALIADIVVRLVTEDRAAVEHRGTAALRERRTAAGPRVVADEQAVFNRHVGIVGRVESARECCRGVAVVLERAVANRRIRQAVDAAAIAVAAVRRRTMGEEEAVHHAPRGAFGDEQAVPRQASVDNRNGRFSGKERQPLRQRQVLVVDAARDADGVPRRRCVDRRQPCGSSDAPAVAVDHRTRQRRGQPCAGSSRARADRRTRQPCGSSDAPAVALDHSPARADRRTLQPSPWIVGRASPCAGSFASPCGSSDAASRRRGSFAVGQSDTPAVAT